jgi:hypothetical protein
LVVELLKFLCLIVVVLLVEMVTAQVIQALVKVVMEAALKLVEEELPQQCRAVQELMVLEDLLIATGYLGVAARVLVVEAKD